jgi:hypothetical protein
MIISANSYNKFFVTYDGDQSNAFRYFFTNEESQKLAASCEQCEPKFNGRLIDIKNKYFSGRKYSTEEIIRDIKADQR